MQFTWRWVHEFKFWIISSFCCSPPFWASWSYVAKSTSGLQYFSKSNPRTVQSAKSRIPRALQFSNMSKKRVTLTCLPLAELYLPFSATVCLQFNCILRTGNGLQSLNPRALPSLALWSLFLPRLTPWKWSSQAWQIRRRSSRESLVRAPERARCSSEFICSPA